MLLTDRSSVTSLSRAFFDCVSGSSLPTAKIEVKHGTKSNANNIDLLYISFSTDINRPEFRFYTQPFGKGLEKIRKFFPYPLDFPLVLFK